MKTFDQYAAIANEAIANIKYPEQPSGLYAPIAYTMASGGKRLRPSLALMACEAAGGDIQDALLPAIGLELFHNFTLLHDDVMDRADIRRGRPTVHCKWNDNTAILSGDAMLTFATQFIAKTTPVRLPRMMELFNKTAMEIYEGQQYDMDFEQRDNVSVDEYIEMIRLKTSVLLGCACKLGAIAADADEETADAYYKAGENMGLAFQLQDDMLDVWGDPATFGKEIGGDIMNNKKTFLLINAVNLAKGDDAAQLHALIADTNAQRDIKVPAVRAIYEHLRLREMSTEAINRYNDAAVECLDHIDMSDEARKAFTTLFSRLIKRDK